MSCSAARGIGLLPQLSPLHHVRRTPDEISAELPRTQTDAAVRHFVITQQTSNVASGMENSSKEAYLLINSDQIPRDVEAGPELSNCQTSPSSTCRNIMKHRGILGCSNMLAGCETNEQLQNDNR